MLGRNKVHSIFAIVFALLSIASLVVLVILDVDYLSLSAAHDTEATLGSGLSIGITAVFIVVLALATAILAAIAESLSVTLSVRSVDGGRTLGILLSVINAVCILSSAASFALIYIA